VIELSLDKPRRLLHRLRHRWSARRRTSPDRIIASGTKFTSAPAIRNRPLCPYPQEARYVGPADGDASNYGCGAPK
jgi:hypothetical protein